MMAENEPIRGRGAKHFVFISNRGGFGARNCILLRRAELFSNLVQKGGEKMAVKQQFITQKEEQN